MLVWVCLMFTFTIQWNFLFNAIDVNIWLVNNVRMFDCSASCQIISSIFGSTWDSKATKWNSSTKITFMFGSHFCWHKIRINLFAFKSQETFDLTWALSMPVHWLPLPPPDPKQTDVKPVIFFLSNLCWKSPSQSRCCRCIRVANRNSKIAMTAN